MIITSETASIAKFVIENAVEGTVPYYEEMRADFAVPSVFFPSPVVISGEDTLSSYTLTYSCSLIVFDKNNDLAFANAKRIVEAIRGNKCLIPVVDADGDITGKYIRITQCDISPNDDCAKSIDLKWKISSVYIDDCREKDKSRNIKFKIG